MKWYETVDIVGRESDTAKRKMEQGLQWLRDYKEQRNQQVLQEAQQRKDAMAEAYTNYLQTQKRFKAIDELNDYNDRLHQMGAPIMPVTCGNIEQQWQSQGQFGKQYMYEVEQAAQVQQQAAEQKIREDVVTRLLRDGLISPTSSEEVAEREIQQAIARGKAENALKAGDYETSRQWTEEADRIATGHLAFDIAEEGTYIAQGVRVMPDLKVYEDSSSEPIGELSPETGEFKQYKPGAWAWVKAFLGEMWKNIPLNPYYWMSQEERQMVEWKRELVDYATQVGIENPEEWVADELEKRTSGELVMRALTPEEREGMTPAPRPPWVDPTTWEAQGYTKGEEFVADWVAPMLIMNLLKIPVKGPKVVREALRAARYTRGKPVQVAARAAEVLLKPAEIIETAAKKGMGGIINRIPLLKRHLIDNPFDDALRVWLKQQGIEPTDDIVRTMRTLAQNTPVPKTSAEVWAVSARELAAKYGGRAVARYAMDGDRMSEAVIKEIIAHAKKTGQGELRVAAERFLVQWKASKTASAQAELMRGDLFIKWFGELEAGGVQVTDDVISLLGRTAARETERQFSGIYYTAVALQEEQAAHTLVVGGWSSLSNIAAPKITAEVVGQIFGKGVLPVTGALVTVLKDLGVENVDAMTGDEAWAALFSTTLPDTPIDTVAAIGEDAVITTAPAVETTVGTQRVVRAEEQGGLPDVGKPQGLYVTPQGNQVLIEDISGARYEYDFTAQNPLSVPREMSVRHERGKGLTIPASSGIKALKQLVGEAEFTRLIGLSKTALRQELSKKYPTVEWGRFQDSYEMLEGYAGILAREKGYDAIIGDADEIVVLSSSAITAVEPTATPQEGVAEATAALDWEGFTGVPAEVVEVTIEGLQPIKNIRVIQQKYIQKREDVAALKTELVKYTKENLPKEVQGKMLYAVRSVKTPAQLKKAIDRANEYAEVAAQKTLTTQIKAELAKIKPTRVGQRKYGKLTWDVQNILEGIKKNLGRTREDVIVEMGGLIEAIESGVVDADKMEEYAAQLEILGVSGLIGMSSDDMARALNYVKTLRKLGRSVRSEQREQEAKMLAERVGRIVNIVTAGKGLKPGTGTVDTSRLDKRTGVWENLHNRNLGLDDLGDKISKFDKTSKPYQSVISNLIDTMHLSRAVQIAGEARWHGRVAEKVSEIYQTTSRSHLNETLNNIAMDEVEIGVFKNIDGKEVTLTLTRDQLIERWMQLQDPTLEKTFRDGMKWTDEMMAAVNDKIPGADLVLAKWLMKVYQEYARELAPYYREKFNLDLPVNPYYSPLSRDIDSPTAESVAFVNQMFAYSSATSKHLLARVKSIAPLRTHGALSNYVRFITEMEHFKAFGQSMKQVRQVFGNKEVRTAINQYHGRDILRHIDKHLNDIARDGVDKAKLDHHLDKIRRNFTLAVLANPSVSVRQLVSLPAYTLHENVPIKDFFEGVADFWKDPIGHMKEIREASPYHNERWGAGHERDVRLVMQKGWQGKLSKRGNWRDHAMIGIRFFDTLATVQGAWAIYKSMLKQGKTKGEAVLEAEIATKRTQPSFGMEDMAGWRKEGSWAQLFTMFMSQPNKYYRVMSSAIRNLQYGRGDPKRQIYNIIMTWAVLPMIFQFMTDAFQWKKGNQARAAILGPINYMFIASDIAEGLWGHFSQESPYQYSGSPVFTSVQQALYAAGKLSRLIDQGQDPMKDLDTDYLIGFVEDIAEITGKGVGIPTPYAVQVERAIRNADFRQLVFSEYALSGTKEQEAEKKVLGKIQDAYAVSRGKSSWSQLSKEDKDYFWQLRPDLKRK